MTYKAEELETRFKKAATSRMSQKKAGKKEYENDADYWDGGRCNWGGAHNLKEDCETLGKFFTGITELRNARKELINFNNQQEFEKNKQSLLTKTAEAINGLNMKTSNSTSIAGVCIIWNDFVSVWKERLDEFRKDLELLKTNIENVPYNEAKELQKLNIEERALKREIEDNERKAKNETDENKKKQFLFLAEEAKEQWKKLLERKKQLKTASLGDNFNPDQHIDDFLKAVESKLSGRNRPQRPTRTNPNASNSSGSSSNTQSTSHNNYSPFSNNEPNSFLEKYWKELLLGIAFLLGAYYILNQNDNE